VTLSSGGIGTELGILGLLLLMGGISNETFKRFGQSALLGELLVGVILGPSLLGWLHPTHTLELLMELGLLMLLVETGIETDWRSIMRVGGKATLVALTGIILPLVMGTLFAMLQGLATMASIMVGATLTATSIGITARTLTDLRMMNAKESQIIIGAAVLDDIIGLGILGVMQSMIAAKTVQASSGGGFWLPMFNVLIAAGVFVLFRKGVQKGLVPRLGIGVQFKKLLKKVTRLMDTHGSQHILLVGLVLLACWVSESVLGISMALAAFTCGLILRERHDDPKFYAPLQNFSAFASIVIPIFFIGIGMQLDLRQLNPFDPTQAQNLTVALILTVVAIISKAAAGYAVRDKELSSAFIGMGMVPRGEVGLIFVTVGKAANILNDAWANILIVVVIATTFIAPMGLKLILGKRPPVDDILDAIPQQLTPQPEPGQPLEDQDQPTLWKKKKNPTLSTEVLAAEPVTPAPQPSNSTQRWYEQMAKDSSTEFDTPDDETLP
jgi:Kef-type K+ transport system membrane component KefB